VQSSENSVITLRGSTDIIVEFFQYAITCILYQRGIYPAEDFDRISKYGLVLHVAKEEGLVTYLKSVLNQLKGRHTSSLRFQVAVSLCPTSFWSFVLLPQRACGCVSFHIYVWDPVELTSVCVYGTDWLTSSNVQKVVVVVNGMDSNEVLERWVFNVETAREAAANPQ
jgi:hypothetical protein